MTFDAATKAFDFLRTLPAGLESWSTRQTDVEVGDLAVLLALDPRACPSLLVPAQGVIAGPLLATRGFIAKIGPLADGATVRQYLIVTCEAPSLTETFAALCDDVLAHLRLDVGSPVKTTQFVLERWRQLMSDAPGSLLGIGQCAGLLAELHVLEGLCPRLGAAPALEAWTGHDKSRFDFRFPAAAIEVKATLGRERFAVGVHGILQLDDEGVGALYLAAEQVELVPSGGDSLPECIDRLLLTEMSTKGLYEGLLHVGYHLADTEAYRTIRFGVLDTRAIRIGPLTPRITAGSFVNNMDAAFVFNLRYSIDLTNLTEIQGRLDGWEAIYLELVGGDSHE